MNRALLVFSFLILFLNVGCPLFGQAESEVAKKLISNDDRTAKIIAQNAIEAEATKLAEAGFYDQAIQKYQEAIRPELINREAEKGFSLWSILQIRQWQGKYELAFEKLQWFLRMRPDKENYQDKKLELEALIKARDTKSDQPIYEHIRYLKEKYFPQKGFRGDADTVVPIIIRLYDHIGDYDQGVSFVDEMRTYGLRQNRAILNVKTAQEAWQKFQELRDKRKAEWHEYKFAYEYLKIREAYLEDKKENRLSCIGRSTICIGRATKTLIQSDYFPW